MSVLSFSICNWFIIGLTEMGAKSLYYFCSGSLLFSIIYFTVKCEWSRVNDMAVKTERKVLFRTWDNKFCWRSLLTCFGGAAFQTGIYLSIVLTYYVALKAKLNMGIA